MSQGAADAHPPRFAAALGFAPGPAGVEERRSVLLSVVGVAGGPSVARVQPGAAVQLGRVATVGVPRAGGVAQPPVQPPALDVLVEPGAQAGPFPQQRLVGHLDGVAVDGEQPPVGERVERGAGVGVVLVDGLGRPGGGGAGQVAVVAGVAQPEQQPARRGPGTGAAMRRRRPRPCERAPR